MFSKYVRFFIKEYLFTLFSTVFLIFYWSSAYKLKIEAIRYPIFFSVIAIIMIIWNLYMSVREFRQVYNAEGDEKKKWDCSLGLSKKKLSVIGATLLYVILIPVLGYCVSTFLYLVGMVVFLGERRPVKIVLYSLIMTGFLYLIFGRWLMIRLPTGFLI